MIITGLYKVFKRQPGFRAGLSRLQVPQIILDRQVNSGPVRNELNPAGLLYKQTAWIYKILRQRFDSKAP